MEKYFPPFYNIIVKKIKKLAYIHDLGGILTKDGLVIKHHKLIRSSNLSKINSEGVDRLADNFKVKRVIDLRTEEEIKQNPEDFITTRIEYLHLPSLTNEQNPAINKLNRLEILDALVHLKGGVKAHMKKLYRTLVNSKKAQNVYKEVFKNLLDDSNDGAILYHCTQGKDRTGVLTYLILSALGVSSITASNVYMSFNRRSILKRVAIWIGMNVAVSPRKAVALNNCLIARRIYINSAIEELDTQYNGVENYLKNQIGLSDEDITKLRNKYLRKLGEKER